MQCELCGRECDCRVATVDGVRMMLCPGCMKYGTGVKSSSETITTNKTPILNRIKRPKVKDVYKDMDKELVSGWNDLIRDAREKKGLTREQLGFKIGERTVTIAKIENGDLRPSDKVVSKLEKELNIRLIEEVSSANPVSTTSHYSNRLTLGDLIKKEEK